MKVAITQLHTTRHMIFYLRLADYLTAKSVNVCFISNKKYIKKRIKKSGYECEVLSGEINKSHLSNIERAKHWLTICDKFDINETLDRFVHVEWVQNKFEYYSKNELRNQCVIKFNEMEKIYSELEYDYVIQPLASELDRRIIHYVSKNLARSFYYHPSLLPLRQFMFCSNELGFPYLELNKSDKPVTEIDDLRNSLLNERNKNKYLRKVQNRKDIVASKITLMLHSNVIRYFKSRMQRLLSFRLVGYRKIYERFRKLNKMGLSAKELSSETYIFYTIHQPEEAQTMVRGYHNIDETELLRIVCFNLPPSIKLVVKLHPRVEHTYSNVFIKELTQISNLIFARSGEDSLVLARNSLAVLTISSSIWMECLLENIPCFTFGHGAFDAFHDYPYRIGIDTLKGVIKSIETGFERNRIFDEKLAKSIYQNSFSFERNAFSQDAHRHLGDAIINLCKSNIKRKTNA